MRKCSAIERQMAPTSQGLDHGGIFSRDWFSDRLGGRGGDEVQYRTGLQEADIRRSACSLSPVESVAHLNGDQDGERHGHGIRRLKDGTLDAGELGVALRALQVVGLWRTHR